MEIPDRSKRTVSKGYQVGMQLLLHTLRSENPRDNLHNTRNLHKRSMVENNVFSINTLPSEIKKGVSYFENSVTTHIIPICAANLFEATVLSRNPLKIALPFYVIPPF